jgi:hypothetical protein
MSVSWDVSIDEVKRGGRIDYLGSLVFEAGVTEGILQQLVRAKGSLQRKGLQVGEVHWRELG